ncbi:TetR/AcrR family transcriptional regulator [Kibdelosporangium persicum]|uniref:TetR family transcriptional regulator n=1 Tax=Kibdelosporangium persicum TaxID=2698649 RepID=A0ABX2EYL1_9PSEU|nr:TetR/AcrR family transcriptional regulator [Kibdelosporangium persicum]NRN63797.1 TetR family transcriptional regulator [Kibdelosporangium persicum]
MSRPEGDLRVRRTRRLLRDALVELIDERGFERITVGEITARAMVSRAAFYRNYKDKYHLAEQVFDDALGPLMDTAPETRDDRWVAFFDHIATYERLYKALLSRKAGSWFADKMRAKLASLSSGHLTGNDGNSLTPTILGAIAVQSITWWLTHDRPCSAAEIADHTARLMRAVIESELEHR